MTNGAKAWFEYINQERGGIGGEYRVQLQVADSQDKPDVGVQEYQKMKKDVALFAQVFGTEVVEAVLPSLRIDGIVVSPASLDGRWVRDKDLLPDGAPYELEIINAIDYLLEERGMGGKTFCSLLADDSDGEAGERGITFVGKEKGFTVKTTAKLRPGTPDFTAQVQQMKSAGCQIVLLVAGPDDTAKLMKTSSQLQFKPQWVGVSMAWTPSLATSPERSYLQANFLLAGNGTNWGDTAVTGMAELVARAEKYAPNQPADIHFVFGYHQARVVTALLEKALALGDMSRKGIRTALTELGTVESDGLIGNYEYGSPESRTPPRQTTIYKPASTAAGGLAKLIYQYQASLATMYRFSAP